MEFLVRLTPDLPASFDDEATDALYVQERARGAELMRQGRILRAWRLQDAKGGLLLFDATDTSHLQDLLESLPIYAYCSAEVTVLTEHPLEVARSDATARSTATSAQEVH